MGKIITFAMAAVILASNTLNRWINTLDESKTDPAAELARSADVAVVKFLNRD